MQLNLDLFDTATDAATEIIPVDAKINTQNLTKAQKRFNSLIEKIDKLKHELGLWQRTIPRVRERVATELTPLIETFDKHRAEFAHLLDSAYEKKIFKKKEKEKLRHLICSITSELLGDDADHALKALHDKHSEVAFDELAQEKNDMVKTIMADILGVELPDEMDLNDEHKFAAFMQEKMHAEQSKAEARERAAEEKRAKRKKSAKQLEREAQQQAQAQDVRKSIQEVFRKLAAALHPDRESDPVERERKTALMQRVNVAYNKKDLLQLLELQLEVEQIDQSHLSTMSDARLVHFNKILKEQCDELQQELAEIQIPFKMQFDVAPYVTLSIADITLRLDFDIKDIKASIADLRGDLKDFKDPNRLRAWLRRIQMPKQAKFDEFDFPF
ncbi:MAG: hypothetical protein AABY83_01915 [Pseudomonadota bacterium]